jgi:hypothetical protein
MRASRCSTTPTIRFAYDRRTDHQEDMSMKTKMKRVEWFSLALCVVAPFAFAQSPPAGGAPKPIVGAIKSVDDKTMVIETKDGQTTSMTFAPNVRLMTRKDAKLADIEPGAFIGTTAVKQADGRLHATEVHIFPEALRGLGEGHRSMGPPATSMSNGSTSAPTMTNGTVSPPTMTNGTVSGPTMTNGKVQANQRVGAGTTMKVTYQGGEQEVAVGPDAHVTVIVLADKSQLQPGTPITALTQTAPDGSLVAAMINIGPPLGAAAK